MTNLPNVPPECSAGCSRNIPANVPATPFGGYARAAEVSESSWLGSASLVSADAPLAPPRSSRGAGQYRDRLASALARWERRAPILLGSRRPNTATGGGGRLKASGASAAQYRLAVEGGR